MSFNSVHFLLFFISATLIYHTLPHNLWRKTFLLAASYYFYACWNVSFLLILMAVTGISYGLGRHFSNRENRSKKKLGTGITLLLLPLLCFKYLNFLLGNINVAVHLFAPDVSIPLVKLMLPIGISFFTFMAIGYVVDVYKEKIEAESNLLDYSLFIGFFPQISSGPIGRAGELIPQFKAKQALTYDNFATGARMMLWGFFMKLVVGDRAGVYVDTVFSCHLQHSGLSLIFASILYSIQLYCDFAGYSLVAIGAARVMGYRLMTNFTRPYFAYSIGDFWRRWHISLSTWFRDYIYIPMGGNRCSKLRQYLNIMVTFLVSGLWHGAAWTFIIWGGCNALCQIFTKETKDVRDSIWNKVGKYNLNGIRRAFNIILTFLVSTYLWMIFRTPDLNRITEITAGYLKGGDLYIHPTTLLFFGIGFSLLLVKEVKDEYFPEKHYFLQSKHAVVRYATFASLLALIAFIGVLGNSQFIYFQF